MAKSKYLPGLLLLSFIGLHFDSGSDSLGREYQVSGIKYKKLGLVFTGGSPRKLTSFNFGEGNSQISTFRPPASADLRNLVKTIYDSQIGILETGSNRGPEVKKYLRYVNVKEGNPWCAAFVCWVLGNAGVSNPRSAWSPDLFPKSKIIWARGNARPKFWAGDVFGLFFAEKNRIAHAGFIDQQKEDWLITVEGNTNISSEREGDGVYRKRRLVRSVYRVARFVN